MTHPLVISSPSEVWFAALTPSKARLAAQLSETRLARVPVPVEHEGEYGEWYEQNPEGEIVAWVIAP